MKKFAIAAVMVASLSLGGCTTVSDAANKIIAGIEDVANTIKVGVGLGKSVALQYCGDVSNALAAVNSVTDQTKASCKAKNAVQKIATSVASFCNNVDSINASNIGSVLTVLKKAKADAQSVVAAGC